jgi:iron complex outermembrane receptor protein
MIAFRASRGAAALLAGLAGWAVRAQAEFAEPRATTEEPTRVGQVIVTGSRLQRLEVEKVLPVTILDDDFMESRNAFTPVDLLTAVPQITNAPLNEATPGAAQARGDNANVNLRGIGVSNTLVLLNGRRLAPNPIASLISVGGSLEFSVNVNSLPTRGIARIDILRDGASSIYGADAVAGVINDITKRDFYGTELFTRLGVPEHGGGAILSATLTHGAEFAEGKGRWLVTIDGFQRHAIPLSARSFTANADHTADAPAPFNVAGSVFDGRSLVSVWPQFRIGAGTAAFYFRPVNGTPTLTSVAPSRTANPEFLSNFNADQILGYTRSDRQNIFQSVEYDLGPRVTVFGDLLFYHAHTRLQRESVRFSAPSADPFATITADNPYNPYGARFYSPTGAPNADGTPRLTGTPQSLVLVSRYLTDFGPDKIQVFSGAYRGVAGVRGQFSDLWTWETAALYSRANTSDQAPGEVRLSLFQQALARTDSTAYNPFGYTFKIAGNAIVADQPFQNPPSVLGGVQGVWRHEGFSSIASVDAHATGPLFSYWGNTMAVLLGGEFRKEEFADHRPEYSGVNPPGFPVTGKDSDFLALSPKPDSSGDRTVTSGFAEVVLPLLPAHREWPLLVSLELTASARFEHYSDFGDATSPKVGLNWKPWHCLMVRASFNEGFTAPNLPTINAPTQYVADPGGGVVDPYWSPVTGRGAYSSRNILSGNPQLKPVTARGRSMGVVLEVPGVKGLAVTADYWQIDQSNVIGTRSIAQVLTADLARLNAYVQAQFAAGKTIAQIDLGSGTANYQGDPAVVRFGPTAQDIADFNAYNATHAPAQQLPVVGQIFSKSAAYENFAKGYASGLDLGASYASPEFAFGRIRVSTDWAYLIRSYQIRAITGAAPLFIERMNVDGTTRWRGAATITWRRGGWTAHAGAYYIGAFADPNAPTTAAIYTNLGAPGYLSRQFDSGGYLYRYVVPDVTTFNAGLGYHFGSGAPKWIGPAAVSLGVVNLTDRHPPLAAGAGGYYPSVHQNLVAGRTWTLELTRPF